MRFKNLISQVNKPSLSYRLRLRREFLEKSIEAQTVSHQHEAETSFLGTDKKISAKKDSNLIAVNSDDSTEEVQRDPLLS